VGIRAYDTKLVPVDHGAIPFGKLRLIGSRFEAKSGNSLREPISKIARAKWIWRCGSNSIPNFQEGSPEFKSIHKTNQKIHND
jgi:hypothetical protein